MLITGIDTDDVLFDVSSVIKDISARIEGIPAPAQFLALVASLATFVHHARIPPEVALKLLEDIISDLSESDERLN